MFTKEDTYEETNNLQKQVKKNARFKMSYFAR